MARHRLLPAGEAGRGMAQLRADRGGRGITRLHGAPAQEGGDTAAITKRGRAAEPTARPLRQGAGTGPGNYNEARRPCRLRLSQIDQPPNLLGL